MVCISSVSFEVLINGGKIEQFKPSRGLRQEDPLSPYLFILGQEVLSRLIEHEMVKKKLSGARASIASIAITHVMYADDIVLFSKATRRDAITIIECLETYFKWSGQSLNKRKSGVFFSKNTQAQSQRAGKHILQMSKLKKDQIYLGAPMFLSKAHPKTSNFCKKGSSSSLLDGEANPSHEQVGVL